MHSKKSSDSGKCEKCKRFFPPNINMCQQMSVIVSYLLFIHIPKKEKKIFRILFRNIKSMLKLILIWFVPSTKYNDKTPGHLFMEEHYQRRTKWIWKSSIGFCIPKKRQILKHFSRVSKLENKLLVSEECVICTYIAIRSY